MQDLHLRFNLIGLVVGEVDGAEDVRGALVVRDRGVGFVGQDGLLKGGVGGTPEGRG